jgi:hypothetical protein|tara:strand:+ start:3804 stop:3962 length:159 start_codon:yes stop_codon:yes gene_type:complete
MKAVKILEQVGKSNLKRDRGRKALPPSKRVSASGKVYWETRKNRSDAPNKKV